MEPKDIELTPEQHAEAAAYRDREDSAAFLSRHRDWNKPLALDFDGEHNSALEDARFRLAAAEVGALHASDRDKNALVFGQARDLGEAFQSLQPAADMLIRRKQIDSLQRAYDAAGHDDFLQHIKAHPELSYLLTEGDLRHFSGLSANLKRFKFAWDRGLKNNELGKLRDRQADGDTLSLGELARLDQLSAELRQTPDSSDGSFLGYSAKTLGEMGPFLGEVILGGLEGAGTGALAGSVIPGAGTASGAAGGAARATLINAGRVLRFLSRATPTKVGAGMGSYMSSEHISTGLSYDRYIQEFTSKHGRPPTAAELESLGTRANLSGHAQSLVELAPLYSALHLAGGAGQKLMRQIGLKNPYAVGILGSVAAVGGQVGVETAEEFTQQAIELGLSPVDHSGAQWADELSQSAKAGATAGLWLGLIPGGISGIRHFQGQKADNSLGELKQALDEQEKIDAAHAGAATLQGIHQAVQASDLAKLSDPAALKTLAAEMVKDSPLAEISLDSASLAQVISSESITVKSALQHQFPELADQIASQSEVTMSLADYIAHIAPLTKADELLPGARLDQDGLSLTEAQHRETELPKILKAANAALKEGRVLGDSAEKVREEVQQMARDQGVDEEQAMSWGYLYAHFFATQARRAGQDPHELFKSYGWGLKTAETAAAAQESDAPTNATQAATAYASAQFEGEVREDERAPGSIQASPAPEQLTLNLPPEDQPLFFDEVGMTKLGTWDAGIKEIHSHDDLARAIASITQDPQENMIGVATDKKGKILAIHSIARGVLDRASFHPREGLAWLSSLPKAANLWLAHNHPGGDSSLSAMDIKSSEGVEKILRGTHITYHGLIAAASTGSNVHWTAPDFTTGYASASTGTHKVPHVRRTFVKQTNGGTMLGSPDDVTRMARNLGIIDKQGFIFTNVRNRMTAFIPFDLHRADFLRQSPRLKKIMEAINRGSPGRFMLLDGKGTATRQELTNAAGAVHAFGIEHLDTMIKSRNGTGLDSTREGNSIHSWDVIGEPGDFNQSAIEEDSPEKRIGQRSTENFTTEEQVAWDAELARRDDKAEVLRQLKQHAGTSWAKQAIEGVFTRAAARLLLDGKKPDFQSALESNSVKSLRSSLEKGAEEFWWRISVKNGLLSEAGKPVNNVSSTFLNCRPSDDCAQYCYATKGNYIFSGSMVKSELVSLAVEMDPSRAAKAVADEYKRTGEYLEKKALRLFDKGDISAEWLPFIAELEKLGVRCHIFSKRPELLRQVSPFHVRLLSIDQSNATLAEQNPDLPVAYVYTERSQLEEIAKLVKRGQMQVILPVKMGSRVLGEDEVKPIRAIPGASKYLCPIDAGVKKLGDGRNNTWNCTKCDKAGGVGCYVGQSTERIQAYNEHKELDEDAQLIERIIDIRSRLQSADGPGVSAPDGRLSAGAGAAVGRLHQRGDAGLDSQVDSLLGELLARLGRSQKAALPADRQGRTVYPLGADARAAPSSGDAESGSTYHQSELDPASRSAAEAAPPLAPNGQPSKLTPTQWRQVRTPEFKAWFGDWENDPAAASKCVDINGEPQVLYHGSGTAFTEFRESLIGSVRGGTAERDGFYFTSSAELAGEYAIETTGKAKAEAHESYRRANKHAVSSMDNLSNGLFDSWIERDQDLAWLDEETIRLTDEQDLRLTEAHKVMQAAEELVAARKNWDTTANEHSVMPVFLNVRDIADIPGEGRSWLSFLKKREDALKEGRDGFVIRNVKDPPNPRSSSIHSDIWGVVDPRNIKSAIANQGSFSPEDSNILHQDRTESYRERDWNEPEEEDAGDLDKVITRKSVDAAEAAIFAIPDPADAAKKLLSDYHKIRHYIRPNNKIREANSFFDRVAKAYPDKEGLAAAIEATTSDAHPDQHKTWAKKIRAMPQAASRAKPWPAGFPDVQVMTSYQTMLDHPDFNAAKKQHDAAAARRLVEGLADEAKIASLKQQFPDAVLVAIHRPGSRNAIPLAFAEHLSESQGWNFNRSVQEAKAAKHTGKGAWHRFARRTEYAGDIEAGRQYLIVDDMVTLGANASELRQYIEGKGGSVAAVVSLASHAHTKNLALRSSTRQKLREKFGDTVLSQWMKSLGLYDGNIDALTDPEAEMLLLSPGSLDSIREKIEATREAPEDSSAPRGSYSSATHLISLFKTADRSTFLHESAHFFLEVMRDLAQRDGASPDLIADWQLILQEFGDGDKVNRSGHELFARSFETWLMKGEAPSPELRPLFQQFRDWLLAVYHSLTGLNHKASPEVKGLFSRMLASDEAVAHTLSRQAKQQLPPELGKKLGIDEKEWQDYLKAAEAAKEEAVKAIDQVYWRPVIDAMNAHAGKARQIRAEVEAEIKAKPAWQVLQALRLGADGQHLNTAALKRRFGDELIPKLPRTVPMIHSSKGTLDADAVAQDHGYADAGELIHDLIRFGSLEDRIREEVDARLRGEDDPMQLARSEGARAVNAALRKGKVGEAGAAVIARELVILRGTGKPWQLIERARAAARQLMLSIPARKILAPAIYARAAEREAANAARLLTKVGSSQAAQAAGDIASGSVRRGSEAADTILGIDANRAEAAAAKERQLMQFLLAREAEKVREERDAIYSRLLDPVSKEVDAEYKAMIEGIRRAIHLYSNPDGTKPELITFLLRERKPEAGAWITPVPDAVLDAFSTEGGIAHHHTLSLVELDEYAATIEALKITGARKALANSAAKKKAEEALIKKLVEDIAGGTLDAAKPGLIQQNARGLRDFIRSDAKLTDTEAWKNLQGFTAAFLRYEQIVALLDGDGLKQRIGEATRQLWLPLDQAQHLENDLILEANKELLKSIDAMPQEQRSSMNDIITVPEVGRQFKRSEILMVLLNLGNRGNAEKLTVGYKWDGPQIRAIVSHLTEEDALLAQKIWDDIGKWWPKINELQLRTTGHGIGKVKATPIRVKVTGPGGQAETVELRGGYFPVIYDPSKDKTGRIATFDEMAALRMFQGATLRAETNQSFTKSRTKAAYPILLDLSALRTHIHRVAHDLSHREAIALTMRTLQHAEVRKAIEKRLGRQAYMQLQPAVEAIAKGAEIDRGQQKLMGAFKYLRSGLTLMGLGYRVSTVLVQFAGVANALEIIGPKAFAKGVAAAFETPAGFDSARAAMLAKSGEMRHRHNMLDRDLSDFSRKLGNEDDALHKFRHWGFWGINQADKMVSTPTWWGAYLDHLDAHPGQEAEAIALADRAVRLSQGAGGMKDLPGWMRGTEFQKLFSMFYTPMNAVFNRLWAHSKAFRLAWQDDKAKAMRLIPSLFMRYLLLTSIPAVLIATIRGQFPDDDETWLTWLAKNNLLYLAGVLPGLRDLAPVLAGERAIVNTPGSQAIEALRKTTRHLTDDEPDFANPETWLDSADLIGYAFRLPLDQLTTIIHNLLEAGRMGDEPLGAKDLMRRR